ncbi:MAG TPA: hypothetical protein ACFCUY_01055 [Xenococcaceae cyanobacterium]
MDQNNNSNFDFTNQESDPMIENEAASDREEYQWEFDTSDSDESASEEAPEYDFSAFESENSDLVNGNSSSDESSAEAGGNPFAGGGNPFGGDMTAEGESGMNTPWDELLQFEEFDNVGDILELEENPFAGGGNPFGGDMTAEAGGNPFAGGGNPFGGDMTAETGGNPFGSSFSEGIDTGVENTDNGNGNNFIGDATGETGSNNQADGNGNWYFGNDNQTNGNGNWYISQASDLPANFSENTMDSFTASLFTGDDNSVGGNIPAFAGGGTPSFTGGGDFADNAGASNNQTEGNGNWYFGENNNTNGNGNWEFGSGNQTDGNANWNLGDSNTITGNGNRPSGDGNMITGNGNQPSGDDNEINGNRVSPEADNQNIVGNGDRYLLMDSDGNIFVVSDESNSDAQYEFDFELLTSVNGDESEITSLDQPFVDNIFSQFMSSNSSINNDGGQNPFAGGASFGGDTSSSNMSFDSSNDSDAMDSDNQDSALEEQLSQSPFGRLLDIPGVDGVEDIFGNLDAGGGENPFAGVGENPFAGGGENPFAGGGENPFAGGGENPFAGGGDESMQSPWDELLQFEEFDSVEDILNDSDNENAATEFNFSETEEFSELFAETAVGDLLNFPGVDEPGDIFGTFGIGDDADSDNLLQDWNPFIDGNPFVVGDEAEAEPVFNADGDRLVVENEFGYLIQDDADERLFLSTDNTIDDGDIEVFASVFLDDIEATTLGSSNPVSDTNPFADEIGELGAGSFEDLIGSNSFGGNPLTTDSDFT